MKIILFIVSLGIMVLAGIIGCWLAPHTPFVTWFKALIFIGSFFYGLFGGMLWLVLWGASKNFNEAFSPALVEIFVFGVLFQIIVFPLMHRKR